MTALENVELPTDALPVDAVLRRAAASVYTLFDFPTLSLSHLPHHRTSIGQQPRSASAGRADKRPGCVYIVVCVCAGRDGGIREEDERGGHKEYASDEKGAGRFAQCEDMEEEGRTSGRDVGGGGQGEGGERMHSDWMIPVCSSVHEPWDNDHVAFCSREDEEGMACVFEIIVEEQGDTKTLFRQFSLNANPFSNQRMGTIRIDIQERPQFISQTCISAVLLNSSPLTDLASIVAEVDANEVFMLHKTNMLEEIGAENELMERSCAGMMDWIGMGGLPEVDEEEEERRKETEAKEEEERLREERKEQELNKVAEETNEQEKRAKEAQPPTSDEHPSHIPLHYRLCRRPSSIIPLSPPHGPSPPYPLHILPRPIQLVLVSLPPHLNQLPRSISAGTKRNLKAMEEGDAQSSVATGQSEVAVSVEQAKKAREELEK
ncbi:hypothetical protein BLNAU_5237 [Blattamonas nauphoetae]|uniref:Uncharacterized protein n=1 Tax=Blattamonas nauphoetae TaxID=2049346 RepID=A0ABQ9Y7P0_9EUKA|nr:hypothetical protein BLNAU_5237 [Blattamonas nauphoetae]